MDKLSKRAGCVLLAVFAVVAGLVVQAGAQNASAPAAAASTTMLQGSAVIDESRAELTKQYTDRENERHDATVSTIETDTDVEKARHDQALKSIEQQHLGAYEQVQINQENRLHENNDKALNDRLAEENQLHADKLAQIPARVAQMIAAMFQGLGGSPGAAPRTGNYPSQTGTGAPAPAAANNPPQTSQPGVPAKPGSPQNPLKGYVSNGPSPAGSGASGSTSAEAPPAPGGGGNPGAGAGTVSSAQGPSAPLDFIPNALNAALGEIPNGAQNLQQAQQSTRAVAQSLEDQWTKQQTPGEAAQQVLLAPIGELVGAGTGKLLTGLAAKVGVGAASRGASALAKGEAAAAKSIGAAEEAPAQIASKEGALSGGSDTSGGSSAAGPKAEAGGSGSNGSGGSGNRTPGSAPEEEGGGVPRSPKVPFSADTPPAILGAVRDFLNGKIGQSVKGITPQKFAGKTWQDVVQTVGNEGKGWQKAGSVVEEVDKNKVTWRITTWKSNDGQWMMTQKVPEPINLRNPNEVPQIFLENVDGGVVRIKPLGVPGGNYASMQKPHYALYVKINPRSGTSWENEALKVVDGNPIPKTPAQIVPPAGIPMYREDGAFTAEFDQWLKQVGWTDAAHQPLAKSRWSPNYPYNLAGANSAAP